MSNSTANTTGDDQSGTVPGRDSFVHVAGPPEFHVDSRGGDEG